MNLNIIVKQVKKIYGWDSKYAVDVGREYCRFIMLREKNKNLSPPDDIDKFWHQHILNTKNYYDFCMKYFKVFVHHDPMDANDQIFRKERLANTIKEYKLKYKDFVNEKVWGIKQENMILQINKNCFNDIFECKLNLKVFSNYDYYEKDKFIGKRLVSKVPKDVIVLFNVKDTVNDLMDVISEQFNHNKIAVQISYNNERLTESENLVRFNEINCLLDAMTHNGYC